MTPTGWEDEGRMGPGDPGKIPTTTVRMGRRRKDPGDGRGSELPAMSERRAGLSSVSGGDALVALDVDGSPRTEGNLIMAPHGKMVHRASRALRDWREVVAWSARIAMRDRSPSLLPVVVSLEFRVAAPKRPVRRHPSVRPDLDKLTRAVFDALSGVVFADDAQVIDLAASKAYGDPGCRIGVWEVLG